MTAASAVPRAEADSQQRGRQIRSSVRIDDCWRINSLPQAKPGFDKIAALRPFFQAAAAL
jgi:hypothetical protein